jgi:hypothetical protein
MGARIWALAMIFSQQKARFDATVLSTFIHKIGVYSRRSVVQLHEECHTIVVSVGAAPPIKPRVVVHKPGSPYQQVMRFWIRKMCPTPVFVAA